MYFVIILWIKYCGLSFNQIVVKPGVIPCIPKSNTFVVSLKALPNYFNILSNVEGKDRKRGEINKQKRNRDTVFPF